jgi:hypothetical protein
MMSKEYHYTNDLSYRKILLVEESHNGKHQFQLWSQDTGDFCGSGEFTPQELQDFLRHYGIKDDE